MPEPDLVTVTAFGHRFADLPAETAMNLLTLETEGAIYEWFAAPGAKTEDGLATFMYYRIALSPPEIVQFVEGQRALSELGEARKAGKPLDKAIDEISDQKIARRLRVERPTEPKDFYAALYGPEVEAVVSGRVAQRLEPVRGLHGERNQLGLALQILDGFSAAARIMSDRGHSRPGFEIASEYDVQDLLFAMLRAAFPDAQRETWTPDPAGVAKRIDIVLPEASIVVETKYVRDAGHARRVADELRIDFETYHSHPACRHLLALVADPDGHLDDPRQFEVRITGLRQKGSSIFEVHVLVR